MAGRVVRSGPDHQGRKPRTLSGKSDPVRGSGSGGGAGRNAAGTGNAGRTSVGSAGKAGRKTGNGSDIALPDDPPVGRDAHIAPPVDEPEKGGEQV